MSDKTSDSKSSYSSTDGVNADQILLRLKEIESDLSLITRKYFRRNFLISKISKLITKNKVQYLLLRDEHSLNIKIIDQVLVLIRELPINYVKEIISNLVLLASTDNESLKNIFLFEKQANKKQLWASVFHKHGAVWTFFMKSKKFAENAFSFIKKHKSGFSAIATVLFFILVILLVKNHSPIKEDIGSSSFIKPHTDGNLDSTFFQAKKDSLIAEGWSSDSIENGQLSECYNFKPKWGKIDNYLKVKVGGGTDVVIKVMDAENDICVRYVFINSGSTYRINKLPEGKYYLKIAYGKEWYSKFENGQCIGRFIRNPIFAKGEKLMDYHLQYTSDSFNIPSYQLMLDVIASNNQNIFKSENISEEEFNQ